VIDEPRSIARRKADVLTKLSAPVADVWVSTTDGTQPFLVPLTMAWWRQLIVLATNDDSPTVRNIRTSGRARLGLGPTRDVVRIDAVLDKVIPVGAPEAVEAGQAYADQGDWDPRTVGVPYVLVLLRPERIEAWREENELAGRHVMRGGQWLA
jgi:hypothetical protein